MSEKLTDAEVLCAWMEPKPPLPDCYSHLQLSPRGWWTLGPVMHGGMEWYPRRNGGPVGLDALREVESRLTGSGMALSNDNGGQWLAYQRALIDATNDDMCRLKSVIHATPEQKIKALAPILRPIVEGGAL